MLKNCVCVFQYMGNSISDKVKNKIIEMLYSWTVAFPNESKIADAYQALKKQGKISGMNFLGSVMSGSLIEVGCDLFRTCEVGPRTDGGQNPDPVPSHTAQKPCVWQRGHGEGETVCMQHLTWNMLILEV